MTAAPGNFCLKTIYVHGGASEDVTERPTSLSQVRKLSTYIKMVLAGSRSLGVDLSD